MDISGDYLWLNFKPDDGDYGPWRWDICVEFVLPFFVFLFSGVERERGRRKEGRKEGREWGGVYVRKEIVCV